MEIVKAMQAYFIASDIQMYDPKTNTPAQARTSNLNEDLGQVRYLFTDKTGTLTENEMILKKFYTSGSTYFLESQPFKRANNASTPKDSPELDFLLPKDGTYFQDRTRQASLIRKHHSRSSSIQSLPSSSFPITNLGEFPATNLINQLRSDPILDNESMHNQSFAFLEAIALCHVVIPMMKSNIDKPGDQTPSSFPSISRSQYLDAPLAYSTLNLGRNTKTTSLSSSECMVLPTSSEIIYQGSSNDEVALVNGVSELQFILKARTQDSMTLTLPNKSHPQRYEILNTIQFSSTRKRSSMIFKYPNGKIILLCKGADSVIHERLVDKESMTPDQIQDLNTAILQTSSFATEGFRVLMYAYRELSILEWESWNSIYQESSTSYDNRQELMDTSAEAIENNLILLGVTAIEDKLQRGVPQTIGKLQRAGIKIWMLTGDKKETAINIGYTCSLVKENSKLVVIEGTSLPAISDSIRNAQKSIKYLKDEKTGGKKKPESKLYGGRSTGLESETHVTLVIEGSTLSLIQEEEIRSVNRLLLSRQGTGSIHDMFQRILDSHALKSDWPAGELSGTSLAQFFELTLSADSIICCRVSPSQKALVVNRTQKCIAKQNHQTCASSWEWIQNLFKTKPSNVTLAIGDGANDIAMLQGAHVGVGIAGREGLAGKGGYIYFLNDLQIFRLQNMNSLL